MKKSKIVNILSIIAILVVCVGLVVYNTRQEKMRIEQQKLVKQQEEEQKKDTSDNK